MNCPACGIPMKLYEKHGIEIDVCPTCRGVWLDRGELEKILEAEVRYGHSLPPHYPGEQAPRRGHGQEKHGRDEHHDEREHHEHGGDHGLLGRGGQHGHHGRRRSLLGELFGGFGGDDD